MCVRVTYEFGSLHPEIFQDGRAIKSIGSQAHMSLFSTTVFMTECCYY
jgi:hypothetical protein